MYLGVGFLLCILHVACWVLVCRLVIFHQVSKVLRNTFLFYQWKQVIQEWQKIAICDMKAIAES